MSHAISQFLFLISFFTLPRHRPACPLSIQCGTHRRFLKARGYNASQAKQMILDCIQWRRTVEDVGIEELYRSIDPFDVRSAPSRLSRSLFFCVFRGVVSDHRRPTFPHSFPDDSVSLRAGLWVSIRYALRPKYPASRNQLSCI